MSETETCRFLRGHLLQFKRTMIQDNCRIIYRCTHVRIMHIPQSLRQEGGPMSTSLNRTNRVSAHNTKSSAFGSHHVSLSHLQQEFDVK